MDKKFKFFLWKIIITIISLLGVILGRSSIDWTNLSNNYINPVLVKEIIYNLSVGVFSAMILVWFIDEISNHIQERQSKSKELNTIRRFDKILHLYIERYISMFYCVVTPIEDRMKLANGPDSSMPSEMPKSFCLKDMRDLYQPTLVLQDSMSTSSISAFFEIELILRNKFISLVETHDFEHFPVFCDIFLNYIHISQANDCRAAILDLKTMEFGKKLLENSADDFYQKFLNGHGLSGNLTSPYIILYELMKQERDLILQYQEEIKKISQ